MSIRRALPCDVAEIVNLFTNTIQKVNAKDYTADQIRVWSGARDQAIWEKKIETQHFIVKEINQKMVGFASIDTTGYLDFMYVDATHQREGIGRELLENIMKKAQEQNNASVWASVSLTAYPFFLRQGFVEIKKQTKYVQGIAFVNRHMEKRNQ